MLFLHLRLTILGQFLKSKEDMRLSTLTVAFEDFKSSFSSVFASFVLAAFQQLLRISFVHSSWQFSQSSSHIKFTFVVNNSSLLEEAESEFLQTFIFAKLSLLCFCHHFSFDAGFLDAFCYMLIGFVLLFLRQLDSLVGYENYLLMTDLD